LDGESGFRTPSPSPSLVDKPSPILKTSAADGLPDNAQGLKLNKKPSFAAEAEVITVPRKEPMDAVVEELHEVLEGDEERVEGDAASIASSTEEQSTSEGAKDSFKPFDPNLIRIGY